MLVGSPLHDQPYLCHDLGHAALPLGLWHVLPDPQLGLGVGEERWVLVGCRMEKREGMEERKEREEMQERKDIEEMRGKRGNR